MTSTNAKATSLPTDLKNLISTFGSAEMVHRSFQDAVNVSIQSRRELLEARWFLQTASDDTMLRVGICPRARPMMVCLGWAAVMNKNA